MDLTNLFDDDTIQPSKQNQEADMTYPLSKLARNEWLDFAMYTVESRAIPNMIDGLKPVQRFYLYSSIQNSAKQFKKVSAVAGVISDYGYNHGETSAAGAGQLMAADWSNNICLVEGRGSFGTRLVQSAAAARYTYTKLSENFERLMKDTDLSPIHPDPEHQPPRHYLPIIPLVLANGARGIATGFATLILPRSEETLRKLCKEFLADGVVTSHPEISFPQYTGKVDHNHDEGKYICYGTYELKSKTQLIITEIPYGFDRESYVKVLDRLEEEDKIVGYEDQCKDTFRFEVRLKQKNPYATDTDKLVRDFKLAKTYTENLTVIDEHGKLREYDDPRKLVEDFCKYRLGILQQRIDLRLQETNELLRWLKVKMQFIRAVLDGNVVFRGKKKKEVEDQIYDVTEALSDKDDASRLLRMNIISLTEELIDELAKQISEVEKMLTYWKKTTAQDQFKEDLKQ